MQALYVSIIVTSMLALVASTEFKNCTKSPAPMEVRIKNCDSLPCSAYVSGELSGKMDFVAPYYVSVLYTTAMAHTRPVTPRQCPAHKRTTHAVSP